MLSIELCMSFSNEKRFDYLPWKWGTAMVIECNLRQIVHHIQSHDPSSLTFFHISHDWGKIMMMGCFSFERHSSMSEMDESLFYSQVYYQPLETRLGKWIGQCQVNLQIKPCKIRFPQSCQFSWQDSQISKPIILK